MGLTRLVKQALREDLAKRGDLTTRALFPPSLRLKGYVVAKERGVLCGGPVAQAVFQNVSSRIHVRLLIRDGKAILPGQKILRVAGPPAILTAERTALNFLQRLSGIATLTRAFVERVRGTRAKIYDTRKTAPGLRELEKYAVRCGGGQNHRMGLYDSVLIKDNHLKAVRGLGFGIRDLESKIAAFKRNHSKIPVEMEAQNLSQVRLALECRADILLLDNMPLPILKKAIKLIHSSPITHHPSRPLIEVSGGVDLKNVRAIALLGPDRISVGRITHSAPALDISLELLP